jgi:ubiquinone/menaquinone biosynthesis C-methylase UbiE
MATRSTPSPTPAEFTQTQRQVWGAGDFADLSQHIADVGERLVGRAGIASGDRVLDVACGTGNASFPAAQAGARVTGLDLVPDLLEAGRRKAAATGIEIEWVEGDAENLPFEDSSFDVVLSTFGHMFAPRHRRAADEMLRVCREGGTIATCTWLPEGVAGRIFAASAAYAPPPPDFASPPILWGTEEHVRAMFGSAASRIEFERHVNRIEWESIEGFADYFMDRFGPLVTARQRLGDRFGELREKIIEVWREANEADDGTLRLPQEYLLSLVRL